MTALATIGATVLSLAALAYLAETDPKRRRVFGLAPFEGRRCVWPALTVILLPGVVLLALGNGAGFIVWLGAVTVSGWGVAALSPAQAVRLRGWATRLAAAAGRALAVSTDRSLARAASAGRWIVAVGRMADRIAVLEGRIAALEAELAAVREARERNRPLSAFGENDDAPVAGPADLSQRSARRVPHEGVR